MDLVNPPCKLEDILSFSFQFQNLQGYLQSVTTNQENMFTKLRDVMLKISDFDELRNKLTDIEFDLQMKKDKIMDLENSVSAHQSKIVEFESKVAILYNKFDETDKKIKTLNEKNESFEELLNNINKLTEENTKSIAKTTDRIDKLQRNHDKVAEQTEKNSNALTKIIDNVSTLSESVDKKFEEYRIATEDSFDKVNKKIIDLEANICNLIDSINEVANQNASKPTRRNSSNNPNITQVLNHQFETANSNIMNEINIARKEMEEIKENYKKFEKSLEELGKKEVSRRNTTRPFQNTSDPNNINLNNADEAQDSFENSNIDFSAKGLDLNFGIVESDSANENILKLGETIKIMSQNIGNKANRDDIEKLNRKLKNELEKLSEKFNDSLKNFEGKIKSISKRETQIESNAEDQRESNMNGINSIIYETIQRVGKEIFDREIKSLKPESSDYIKLIDDTVEENKVEVNKLYENVSNIRKNMTHSQNNFDEFLASNSERLGETEFNIRKIYSLLEEIKKDSGDTVMQTEEVKKEEDSTGFTLKETVKNVQGTMKSLSEKIESLTTKQDSMTAEILSKMKKDLQHESGRVLEEFRTDLKSSFNRIQEQLREKVDRFNLDEFGRRIDSHFNYEINKKIDRLDLKKTNNLINKKIDTLENKISKTLVDTLIDLQMEDTPLIVKKSMNGEKCASCNQFLHGGPAGIPHDHEKDKIEKGTKMTGIYKPGMTKNSNQVNETLEENWKKNSLPQINPSKSISDMSFKKVANKTLRTAEKDRNYNMKISEELDKKYINPTDLIKTVNKAHESVDKKVNVFQ